MKTTSQTFYLYGNPNYNGVSAERYNTLREAEDACIASMKRQKAEGYTVTDQAIIKVEWSRTYDELSVRSEQEIKNTLEIISHTVVDDDEF